MTEGILVVEDNQVNAMILHAMLRKQGYTPHLARDGLEGVSLTESLRPRLVLMDLQMPRMDGFAAAAEIRRRLEADGPAIVAVTANAGAEGMEACLAAGFVYVLSKPVDFNELSATVKRYMDAAEG